MKGPIPIILDCDPGHDDAIALLLALASPELELLGVTTVHGNQTLEKTTANALRVLELAGRADIPVAAGAARPLVREPQIAAHVHGDSGLDGPALPPPSHRAIGQPAVDFIVEQLVSSPRPVTLVPTGPLTNIAQVLEVTGGAIAEGNVTPAAEFNIWVDPEAADLVFRSGLEVTMVALDVTHKALLTSSMAAELRVRGRIGEFVADLVEFFKRYHEQTYGWDGAPIHDAVAVACVVSPGLVEVVHRNVEVELVSDLCLGRTVVDRWRRTDRAPNAHVAVDLDVAGFFALLFERIGALDSGPA